MQEKINTHGGYDGKNRNRDDYNGHINRSGGQTGGHIGSCGGQGCHPNQT